MARAKVSVVIPVYNTEKYVKEALDSITGQELKDLEIIVINDGSTDNSLEVIGEAARADPRIRVFSQENKGLSESRNLGIRLAGGEYIYFMDSDDRLAPDALSDCYRKCRQEALDFVFFDAEIFGQINASVVVNYRRTHLLTDEIYAGPEILDILLQKEIFLSSACLNFIDLAYLKKIDLTFYPGIFHEDELFTFLLFLQAGKVGFMPRPYFKRRVRDDSIMTSRFSRTHVNGYFTVARELIRFRGRQEKAVIRALICRRLKSVFRAILYKTRSMKLKDRVYVLRICLARFWRYTRMKDLVLAFLPVSNLIRRNR